MVGCFGKSKAGHDKDHIYVIVKEEKEYVYLADGLIRTLEHPKKKKKKHIQLMKVNADMTLVKKLHMNEPVRDEEIKRAVKLVSVNSNVQNSDLKESTTDYVENRR